MHHCRSRRDGGRKVLHAMSKKTRKKGEGTFYKFITVQVGFKGDIKLREA